MEQQKENDIEERGNATTPETSSVETKSHGKENEELEPQNPVVNSQANEQDGLTKEKAKASKISQVVNFLKWFARDQWFLLAMGFVILVSSQVQVPASQQHIKRTVITYLSVSIIFFINGCTLETRILLENSMRWKLHAFVQMQCYLVCSAATFAVVSICATNPNFMDPWLLIGFLFIGCAPTTMVC